MVAELNTYIQLNGLGKPEAPAGPNKDDNGIMPLTFMLDGDNSSTISFAINGTNAIQYRTNKMSEWQTYTSDTQIELTSSSDYVQFKNTAVDTSMRLGQFTISGKTKALGNIQSLLNYSTSCHQYCYASMFSGCTSLTEAPELPATTLAMWCYDSMFYNCAKLASAPALPATTLADSCYGNMFDGCTSLTSAPTKLSATSMKSTCYASMFRNCTSLTTAPELPATTLEVGCYSGMFEGCTSLTTVPTKLPASHLLQQCYQYMFKGCSSLINAPELPATELADFCYDSMFSGCTSLQYIKVAFTVWDGWCTKNWVANVSPTGTFVCPAALDTTKRGTDYIPANWSVIK